MLTSAELHKHIDDANTRIDGLRRYL